MKTKLMKLKPDELTLDDLLRARDHELDPATVDDYAAAWASKAKFPPLVAFDVGGKKYLTRGRHRLAAAVKAGVELVLVEVHIGEKWKDAVLNAAASNPTHGLPRSSADKRRAVWLVLRECPEWGDRKIAEHANVSHSMVADCRDRWKNRPPETPPEQAGGEPGDWKNLPVAPEPEVREGKDGRTYKVKPKPAKPAAPKVVKPTAPKADPEPDDEPIAGDALAGDSDLPTPEDSVPFDEDPPADETQAEPDAEAEPELPNADTRDFVRKGGKVEIGNKDHSRFLVGVFIPPILKTPTGGTVVLDGTGRPVPRRMADDFANPRLRDVFEDMSNVVEQAIKIKDEIDGLAVNFRSKVDANPFLDSTAVHDAVISCTNAMFSLRNAIRDSIPFAVCPACGGPDNSCKPCRCSGFMPETDYLVYEESRKRGDM